MYGYQELPNSINISDISEKEVFKLVFGEYPELNKYYVSPLREDTNPGCFFDYYNEKLYFFDYGTVKVMYDCFDVLQLYHKLSFKEAVEYAYYNIKITKKHISVENKKTQTTKKTVILIKPRNFNRKDLIYWNQYGITENQLTKDKVIPVELIKIIKKDGTNRIITPYKPSYAYTEFSPNVKIYSPFNFKQDKWISNCKKNDIGNISNLFLSKSNKLVITKSYKDCRVLRNYGVTSVWFQSEGVIPDNNILKTLLNSFDESVILYDNDNAGILTSDKLIETFTNLNYKSKNIFIPNNWSKDISDLYKKDKSKVEYFINKHKLI